MAPKPISQEVLTRIMQTRAEIEKLQEQLGIDENAVLSALREKALVQKGLLTAVIESKPGRRTTAWKERAIEFVDETRGVGEGEKWAARVIAATKPSDPTEKLAIKFAA